MPFILKSKGSFKKTQSFLDSVMKKDIYGQLDHYAQLGVIALSSATPTDSGVTANSWYYEIKRTKSSITIVWKNSHVVAGAPIAILLQYGHGTGTGGYVEGRDYINPAIKPVMDQIASDVWKVVTG